MATAIVQGKDFMSIIDIDRQHDKPNWLGIWPSTTIICQSHQPFSSFLVFSFFFSLFLFCPSYSYFCFVSVDARGAHLVNWGEVLRPALRLGRRVAPSTVSLIIFIHLTCCLIRTLLMFMIYLLSFSFSLSPLFDNHPGVCTIFMFMIYLSFSFSLSLLFERYPGVRTIFMFMIYLLSLCYLICTIFICVIYLLSLCSLCHYI